MHHRMVVAAAISTVFAPVPLAAQASTGSPESPSPAERYETLSAAGDHAGLVSLWQELPESAIPVIDGDLEGSLALWETDAETKRSEIDALIARAIAGAVAATEATGRRRILDYVTSFAGWNEEQKVSFRSGQRAYRTGRDALREGDTATALEKGRECRALAEPLGDWWGTAMGLQLEGSALAATGESEEAAMAMSRGRLIYRELGLTASALRIEADLAGILLDLERVPRATAMIRDGQETATRLGLEPLVLRFQELERTLERR